MPLYDYECPACAHSEELHHGFAECDSVHLCPTCGADMHRVLTPTAYKQAPDFTWAFENGGRGRYISQLQEKPMGGSLTPDKEAFCRSRNELLDKAKRKGFKISTAPFK